MSGRFLNAMKGHAGAMDSTGAQPRWGVVQSVDPAHHVVKVMMQPEAVLTDWIPVLTQSTGNGWGIVALPKPGQQVLTVFENGDAGHPVVLGAAYSEANVPPKPANAIAGSATDVAAGEFVMRHESGAVLRFCADGTVYAKTSKLNIEGDVKIAGKLEVTQDITGDADVYDHIGKLDGLRQHYDSHMHTGVQTGGGVSGLTTANDP